MFATGRAQGTHAARAPARAKRGHPAFPTGLETAPGRSPSASETATRADTVILGRAFIGRLSFAARSRKARDNSLLAHSGALTTGQLSPKGIASHARKNADIFAEDRVKPQYVLAGSLAALVAVLDQATKALVREHIPLWGQVKVIPDFFNLVHTLNKGAAFGFLNRADIAWQTYFFIATTALAIVLVVNLLSKSDPGDKLFIVALGLILGGAVGNLVDRVRLGEVTDFLEFYLGSYAWPAFNVADIGITLGSFALILSFYVRSKPGSRKAR